MQTPLQNLNHLITIDFIAAYEYKKRKFGIIVMLFKSNLSEFAFKESCHFNDFFKKRISITHSFIKGRTFPYKPWLVPHETNNCDS